MNFSLLGDHNRMRDLVLDVAGVSARPRRAVVRYELPPAAAKNPARG